MAHVTARPLAGKNPVPHLTAKLTSLVNPERATEAKAAGLQNKSDSNEAEQTVQRAERLAEGRVQRIIDPVTGEELEIKNVDQEADPRTIGENVLNTNLPPPGELNIFSLARHT